MRHNGKHWTDRSMDFDAFEIGFPGLFWLHNGEFTVCNSLHSSGQLSQPSWLPLTCLLWSVSRTSCSFSSSCVAEVDYLNGLINSLWLVLTFDLKADQWPSYWLRQPLSWTSVLHQFKCLLPEWFSLSNWFNWFSPLSPLTAVGKAAYCMVPCSLSEVDLCPSAFSLLWLLTPVHE